MTEPSIPPSETGIDQLAPEYSYRVLQYFRTSSTSVATVDDLAAGISEQQDEAQKRVAIRLHHVTLPKLADSGVIEYDARSNTARYRGDEQGDHIIEERER